jgi:hypothetical protein
MADQFQYTAKSDLSPLSNAAAVTLHDTNELANYSRALWVGGAGNLKVTTAGGDTVTLSGIPAGTLIPIRAKVCFSTGSTATLVVALW